MEASEIHVSNKNRGNIEVTSASAFSYVPYNSARNFSLSLSLSHAGNREVHSTTRTTCPHSSGLEMSFAALTAILTASRKRSIATILRQTDDNGQTTCQINKTRIYTFCQHNIPPTKNVQTIINSSSNILFVFCDKRNLVLHV